MRPFATVIIPREGSAQKLGEIDAFPGVLSGQTLYSAYARRAKRPLGVERHFLGSFADAAHAEAAVMATQRGLLGILLGQCAHGGQDSFPGTNLGTLDAGRDIPVALSALPART